MHCIKGMVQQAFAGADGACDSQRTSLNVGTLMTMTAAPGPCLKTFCSDWK